MDSTKQALTLLEDRKVSVFTKNYIKTVIGESGLVTTRELNCIDDLVKLDNMSNRYVALFGLFIGLNTPFLLVSVLGIVNSNNIFCNYYLVMFFCILFFLAIRHDNKYNSGKYNTLIEKHETLNLLEDNESRF